jgi:hypothetical protein
MLLAIEEEKERIRESEFSTIKKVKVVPRHLLKKNQNLYAGYKVLEEKVK